MAEIAASAKTKPGRPLRRAPVRTCVACQEAKTKRELIRVVHTPAGIVEVDPTGKKAGRGAYMCPKKSCWQLGLKKNALERALKTSISPQNRAVLEEYAATLQEK
jgi:predicted RNA-binding protein YlxR (DUF448 family)